MRRVLITSFAIALLAAVGTGLWLWLSSPIGPGLSTPAAAAPRPAAPRAKDTVSPTFELLRKKPSPEEARRSLSELRLSLASLPKDEAVALIREFLERGDDHATGLSFEIAADGSLKEWPSFRTFLLDALLAIDPAAAAAIGREILSKRTNADEWALALRNVAKGEPQEDAAFLRGKTEELINHPAWQAKPSIGYLNAFDVLVHVGATESTPLLSGLIQRKERKDLAHAGFLTLDRLVQREPVDELARLAADGQLQQSRPEMVAQQFARADLRDPAQQALVKSWLLDPARTGTELQAFAGVYPNNNRFVSNNLLTAESAQSGEDLALHDREALKVIVAWSGDPAFKRVEVQLRMMIARLHGFVTTRNGSSAPPE
jgi:hypothetical protein